MSISRRKYLSICSSIGVVAVTGCLADTDDPDNTSDPDDEQHTTELDGDGTESVSLEIVDGVFSIPGVRYGLDLPFQLEIVNQDDQAYTLVTNEMDSEDVMIHGEESVTAELRTPTDPGTYYIDLKESDARLEVEAAPKELMDGCTLKTLDEDNDN